MPQRTFGRFRVDFLTCDDIAWEVDGKAYHDDKKDRLRDRTILNGRHVNAIVRIAASALQFYRDACLASLGTMIARMEDAGKYCQFDVECCNREADWIVENWEDVGGDAIHYFIQIEAFDSDGEIAYVGSPLAFVPTDHEIWTHISRSQTKLLCWKSRIEYRTRWNEERWEGINVA